MSEQQKPTIINQDQPTQTWFSSWFRTTYKGRNYREAQVFMDNITHYLKASTRFGPCGKGRHSIYLNQWVSMYWGADLSENST
jgi:hypothetical protein